METLGQDLRFAVRTLGRDVGFTAFAVATLALGIGASTAVFSFWDAVILRPLAYPDPDRVVQVASVNPRGRLDPVSAADFLDWHAQAQSFTALAASHDEVRQLLGTAEPRVISVVVVTHGYFDVLGVRPARGRAFL